MPRDPGTHQYTPVTVSYTLNKMTGFDGSVELLLDDLTDALNDLPLSLASGALPVANGGTLRECLSAGRTYYVRTDGNDSHTGLADTAGGAFLTIQKAIDLIWGTLDLCGHSVVIQVRSGTLTTPIVVTGRHTGGGSVTLFGDNTTPSNVVISTTSAAALTLTEGARLVVNGFKFTTATSGACVSVANPGTLLEILNFEMGACAASQFQVDNTAVCIAYASGVYTISGSAGSHVHVTNHALFYAQGGTITLTGTPAFSNFFVGMSENATSKWEGITFSGSATGQRFFIHTGAMVNIGGTGTLTYFPGNANGLLSEGGIYDIYFGTGSLTVAALPTPNTSIRGMRTMVSDANATTFLSTVAAGGANVVPVVCDGTNWKIG